MSIAKKIIMGTATTSVIGGSATATYLFFKTTNNNSEIRQVLSKVGFEPLDLTQQGDKDLSPILDAYKSAKKDTFDDILPSQINKELLKERCRRASRNTNNDKEKLLAAKWCSKKQTINDTFNKVGLAILNGDSSEDDWRKLISENNYEQSEIDEFRRVCKDVGKTFTTDDEFAENLKVARHCSIKK